MSLDQTQQDIGDASKMRRGARGQNHHKARRRKRGLQPSVRLCYICDSGQTVYRVEPALGVFYDTQDVLGWRGSIFEA